MIPMPQPIEVEPRALPVGAAVGSFVLRGVHSRDAFGIRYLATASASGGEVLIEEFAPAGISVRDATGLLAPRSPAHAALWDEGLQSFLQESQVLAGALHPAIMRVASLWRIRGTAFRMWPSVEGRTLAEVCATMQEPPSEAWLRGLLEPLLDALESLHGAGWVHGNVRPGQILMRSEGGPMLLDTGAVHKTIGARMPQHPAWPEPGFRAPELGDGAPGQVPGPWSDLYSLAAVARFCAEAPCSARDWVPRAGQANGTEGSRFAAVLDRALLSDPGQRPASVAVFRQQLRSTVATVATVAAVAARTLPDSRRAAAVPRAEPIEGESALGPRPAWLEPMHADRPWEQAAFQVPRSRRWPKLVAGLLGVLMLAAVAAYQFNGYRAELRAGTDPVERAVLPEPSPSPKPLATEDVIAAAPERVAIATPAPPLPDPAPAPAPAPPAVDPARAETLSSRAEPAATAPPSAATPAAACAPRTQFALYRCMKTQCEQRRFADHPQCVQLRLTDEPPG
jgi:hypothetical protein